MKKNFILTSFFVFSLLITFTSCGQTASPYIVDSTIKKIVDENIRLTLTPALSSFKFVETVNDSTSAENYGFGKNLGAITEASLKQDTIIITSFLMARKASFGYKIILTGDTCITKYYSLADEDVLKINKTDKPSDIISFVCTNSKLTFSQKPKTKVGELVEGVVELTTNDFYSFQNEKNTKVKMHLTGYFRTNLSQFRPGEGLFKQIQ